MLTIQTAASYIAPVDRTLLIIMKINPTERKPVSVETRVKLKAMYSCTASVLESYYIWTATYIHPCGVTLVLKYVCHCLCLRLQTKGGRPINSFHNLWNASQVWVSYGDTWKYQKIRSENMEREGTEPSSDYKLIQLPIDIGSLITASCIAHARDVKWRQYNASGGYY